MKKESLQRYFHERIPISRAMGVEVLEASLDRVVIAAPLEPNINHKNTVFGGSASAVAMLSAWGLIFLRLDHEKIPGQIVVRKNTMTYERPITDRFTATAGDVGPSAWRDFLAALREKGRARVELISRLQCLGTQVARLEGEFVAIRTTDLPAGP